MYTASHKLALGISISLHVFLGAVIWKEARFAPSEKAPQATRKLEVRSLSAKELDNEIEARKRLQNTGIIVQSDEQLKHETAPEKTKEKIYLSKHNQQVDKNMRASRVGEFKNVLDEGLDSGDERKKLAGAEAVKAKKEKTNNFESQNLFALATDYKNSDEAKADQLINDRKPSSIVDVGGGRKGKGLSATDDYLDGIAIGANTLLNTQEFKYYSFYERVRLLLVERWRARIRKEIERARRPASAGGRLSQGSKITKLNVRIGPDGNIAGIDKKGLSGIDAFDQAAEISFREAAPFPHPPAEMLKNNELTIQWDFVVLVEDASLVKFNVMRSN